MVSKDEMKELRQRAQRMFVDFEDMYETFKDEAWKQQRYNQYVSGSLSDLAIRVSNLEKLASKFI